MSKRNESILDKRAVTDECHNRRYRPCCILLGRVIFPAGRGVEDRLNLIKIVSRLLPERNVVCFQAGERHFSIEKVQTDSVGLPASKGYRKLFPRVYSCRSLKLTSRLCPFLSFSLHCRVYVLELHGDKFFFNFYFPCILNITTFHCFTVHFDSLSFIHTNSCTFSYKYVSVF